MGETFKLYKVFEYNIPYPSNIAANVLDLKLVCMYLLVLITKQQKYTLSGIRGYLNNKSTH